MAAAIPFAGITGAQATATLACEIDDANLTLDLIGSVSLMRGSAISGVRGSIAIKATAEWPAVTVRFTNKHLTQQWIDSPDARLWLQVLGHERTREINVMIKTERVSEDYFRGSYLLIMRHNDKVREQSGDVSCSFGT